MLDTIIIGSGPAGLAAAIYAKRAELDMLVLEKSSMSGGQVLSTYEVDNYPALPGISGMELGMKMREHADKLGASFAEEEVLAIDKTDGGFKVRTDAGVHETRTVIYAAGAHHTNLNVPGEEDLQGMGVSYCATCDGAFFRGFDVAVVGGGDVAVEDAIFLSRICNKVYLIHRRDSLRAAASLQTKLFAAGNVELVWDSVTERIEGKDEVTGITVKNVKSGESRTLAVSGVFIAVGIRPDSEILEGLAESDEKGYIKAGEDTTTSCPGIYAAGDVRTKGLRQIVTAVADGANAVTAVQDYLNRS